MTWHLPLHWQDLYEHSQGPSRKAHCPNLPKSFAKSLHTLPNVSCLQVPVHYQALFRLSICKDPKASDRNRDAEHMLSGASPCRNQICTMQGQVCSHIGDIDSCATTFAVWQLQFFQQRPILIMLLQGKLCCSLHGCPWGVVRQTIVSYVCNDSSQSTLGNIWAFPPQGFKSCKLGWPAICRRGSHGQQRCQLKLQPEVACSFASRNLIEEMKKML